MSSDVVALTSPNRACQQCNRKKTKCGMQRPVCQLCARTGARCTFPVNRKPSTRNGIARTSSLTSESRLVKLIGVLEQECAPKPTSARLGEDRFTARMQLAEAIENLLCSDTALEPQRELSTAESLVTATEEDRPTGRRDVFSPRPGSDAPLSEAPIRNEPEKSMASASSEFQTADRMFNVGDSSRGAFADQQLQSNSILRLGVPTALVLELVDLFFLTIQPWLPLLHRPRVRKWLTEITAVGGISDTQLKPQDEFLLLCMMALSARFSSNPFFAGHSPLQNGRQFAEQAKTLQRQLGASYPHSLMYLQACVLLTFYCYCSGPTGEGWLLSGVCTRVAYDLGLAETDGEAYTDIGAVDDISKEERRRAWWLVWELDSFASIISRRPFGIDRRRMNVMLPVADEDWFAGVIRTSCKLDHRLGPAWKTLRDHKIEDEWAWFLTATHFVAIIADRIQRKAEINLAEILSMENEISSLKLALPPSFRIDMNPLEFNENTFPKCNRIIGTLLLLMDSTYSLNCLSAGKTNAHFAFRVRATEISRLVRQWPGEYVALAHPFHATSMLSPPPVAPSRMASDDFIISSSRELEKLVLSHFGEKWTLGSVVLECSHILEKGEPPTPREKQLMWRYALYFPSYGTVELGQSRAEIFENDVSRPRAPGLERTMKRHVPASDSETITVTSTNPPAVDDWFNMLSEPVAGDDAMLTLPDILSDNEITFPYVNFFGTMQ